MPLLLLSALGLGFGASSWEEWMAEARDDVFTLLAGLAGFVLLFILLWGTMAYLLARVGFFEQAGKAARGIVDALGISDLWKTLAGLLRFA